MLNRFSALWLVLGIVGGYAVSGAAVTAQNIAANPVPPFLNAGDEVRLEYERGAYTEGPYSLNCTVAEIQGVWIRCERDKFATQRDERWHSLERVFLITERAK